MVFEGAAEEVHAVGEQGRGERVASQARNHPTIEAEVQYARTINAPAA
jgi:hypothetical protein